MADGRSGCKAWIAGLLLASLVAVVAPARAAARWVAVGPEGGSVVALAYDAAGVNVLYAALDEGGVWRSTNGGASWLPVREGLPPGTSRALAVDPARPGTLFLGRSDDGIWKSVDGGESWEAVADTLSGQPADVRLLRFDPDSGALWAALLPKAGQAPLYRSVDGGAHWAAIDLGLTEARVTALVFAGADVYAGTANQGILRASRNDLSWKPILGGVGVQSIAFGGGALFAATSTGLQVSLDRGASWRTRIAPPVPPPGHPPNRLTVGEVAVSPDRPRVVYVGYWLQLGLAPAVSGVYRSADGGRTFAPLAGGFPAVSPQALTFVPNGSGALLAAPGTLGVWRSADGRSGWRSSSRGMRAAPVVKILADPKRPSILYAAVTGVGTMRSPDGGASWRTVPLGDKVDHPLALDPDQPSTLYAYGHDVFGTAFLLKGSNGGRAWLGLNPSGDGPLQGFALDPARPDRLFAARAGFTTTIARSLDGGRSWSGTAVRCLQPRTLAVAATGTVYAGGPSRCGRAGEIEGGVYRSDDDGVTFLNRIAGLPPRPQVEVLAVDPGQPATVFAGMESFVSFSTPSRRGVFRSRDGAEHWEAVAEAGDLGAWPVDFAFAPDSPPSIWLATTGAGAWHSGDGGASFRPAAIAGLPTGIVFDLEFDHAQPATLYAATGGGLFRLTSD